MHPRIWLQADTPEAMLREMLEMSNLELQLRSQLAEEAEGRYQRTISEQQAIRRGGSLQHVGLHCSLAHIGLRPLGRGLQPLRRFETCLPRRSSRGSGSRQAAA